MDLDEEYSSKVIDSMNRRKGKLIDLKDTGKDKKRLIFNSKLTIKSFKKREEDGKVKI